ncbi:MAG: hypothetical protein CL928_17665 [Deltaproteobacteria bacterium]|nr:hypothetical protein [Deltaproteobacteria bacterium]
MKSVAGDHWGFLATCAVYLLFSLFGLDAIPRPFGDEAWYAIPTLQLVEQNTLNIPVIPGRGDISVAYVQPKLALNLLSWLPVSLFGAELAVFRLVSLSVTMLAALCLYVFTLRMCGKGVALTACVAFLICFWTVLCGRCFRPEIFATSFSLAALTCAVEGRLRNSSALIALAALSSVLALLSHQVVWLFLPPALFLVGRPHMDSHLHGRVLGPGDRSFLKRYALWLVVLISPYLIYVVTSVLGAPTAALLDQFYGEGGSSEWSIAAMVDQVTVKFARFFLLPRGLFFLLASVAGAVLLWRTPRTRPVAHVIVAGLVVLSVVPLTKPRYLFVLAPYLSIGIAQLVGARATGYWGKVLFALYVCSMLAVNVAVYSNHRDASYADVVSQLREVIPDGVVVAGPLVFALGLYTEDYQVTNVSPTFAARKDVRPRLWLNSRLQRSDYILEVTSTLFSTGGLGPRPERFRSMEHLKALGEFLDQNAVLVSTIPSRDYGPIRVWKRTNKLSGATDSQ